MARRITLSFPHNLTEAEVRARLVNAIEDARKKHPNIMGGAHELWSGNRMDFRFTVFGQTATGDVLIEPQTVVLHVDLPLVLAMLADRIRPQLEAEARKMLGGPKDRSSGK